MKQKIFLSFKTTLRLNCRGGGGSLWKARHKLELKGKVVPVPKHHVMDAVVGVGVKLHAFEIPALDGGE
jgi:hypothetical protein